MTQTALLLIDMQVGNFLGSDPIYNATELLVKIKNLVIKARLAKIPIFYIQHRGCEGDPDAYGSPGWEIHPDISPNVEDVMVEKQTPDVFYKTTLQHELSAKNIKRLVIAGLQSEYCVDTTCRRAYALDYDIIPVQDAHSTWDSPTLTAQQIIDHHNAVLGGLFVSLKKENDIKF